MKPQTFFQLCTFAALAGLGWEVYKLRREEKARVAFLGPEDRTYWPDSLKDKKTLNLVERLHADEIAGMRRRHNEAMEQKMRYYRENLEQERRYHRERMQGYEKICRAIGE